ncbi:hypothetical protein IFM89_023762 [Coptis chinensis]|uniref:Uncharacterized protein n=1 Tax=Coptis chinensis TaxID=261450 RepID=A0A835GZ35_9MAGN|nr:hypothetical protein IFM89_023762 [Coptis chinensis]
MALLKTLSSSHHLYTFLKHQHPSLCSRNSLHSPSSIFISNVPESITTSKYPIPFSLFQRKITSCAELVCREVTEDLKPDVKMKNEKEMKKEKFPIDLKLMEIDELKKKVRKLEMEVRSMKTKKKEMKSEEQPRVQLKGIRLSSLFECKTNNKQYVNVKKISGNKPIVPKEMQVSSNVECTKQEQKVSRNVKSKRLKKDEPMFKDIWPEMRLFANRLYEECYLNELNFLRKKEFDLCTLGNRNYREFLRFAAEKFGRDHQEIAKWLSGRDLKKVALFGCPSVDKKSVFAAKKLRHFFNIQEDIVCRGCKLNSSCKFVNKTAWDKTSNLNLADALRTLTSYSLDLTLQLAIPNEVKVSISKLLKEVVDLNQ